MTFRLEPSTGIEIRPTHQKLELIIEDYGINKVSIMQELIDEFGFDLIFNSLCETRLKDLKRELDKRISEVEMTRDEIIYFLEWGLEWLIPYAYEKEVKQIKKELGL